MKKIIILFNLLFYFIATGSEESKTKMKELIEQIRDQSDQRILITQNGSDIYFNNRKLDYNFLKIIDGVSQESLFFGMKGLNEETTKDSKRYILKNLIDIRKVGKPVFSINYSNKKNLRYKILKNTERYRFIGEAVPSYSANSIFEPLQKSSLENIYSLNQVKNFLYLLNPEKFKSLDDYYRALKNTDFDLLIIEPSLNGKFFIKQQINSLKIRKNGKRRLVIAYFSIGEAENYRYYWKISWNKNKPNWIIKENPIWKGNFIVKYWDIEWKNIIKNYQNILNEIDVDGYYLDTIDTYQQF
ncbi:MAG: endo alpha-1,4 polygalactosaminidase [Cetobacterium sp.]|nr:endo alpha-1,4 polygalactosaminidase [Cetobacterium sp.]